MKASNCAIRTAIGAALMAAALAPDAAAGARRGNGWNGVARLQPGTIVAVTARGAAPMRCLAAFADRQTLVLVRFVHARSPERVERALRSLPPADLAVLRAADIRVEGIVFSHGAVLDGAIKVADVIALPRDEIVEIEVTERARRGSTAGAIIGASVGGVAALLIAPSIMLKQCGGSCDDEKALLVATAVGLPVGGGLLGYYAGRSIETHVIYSARTLQPLGLDEASWQRVRSALPPSLRGEAAGKLPEARPINEVK